MSELDVPPWQQPETVPATTQWLDESPFAAGAGTVPLTESPFGAEFGLETPLLDHEPQPALMAGEAETWGHLWADWHPVTREEEEEEEAAPVAWLGENQISSQPPKVTTTFPQDALAELPDVLRAKPLVSLEATVSTEKILWMIYGALANRGSEPGWVDRLLIDVPDLPKAAPTATVHITVFEAVPFGPGADKLRVFERFSRKAYPAKEQPYYALSLGPYTLNRALEEVLDLPPGSVAKAAGLPTQLTADRAPNYKIVVYAVLPRRVGMVVAPADQRALRGFAFDKSTLIPAHELMLDSLAREVVKSWYSRSIVTRIVVQGHTDPVGTRDYNYALGRRRAEAVAARLRELIIQHAGSLSAGTVDRIQYVIESYGKDRPSSTRLNSLNRRVELTVYRDTSAPPTPLKLDQTVQRLTSLLASHTTLDTDTVSRIRCLLGKLQTQGTDDRFASDTQVFLMKRDNEVPKAAEWNRVLSRVLAPELFGPQISDDQVIRNLSLVDEDIAGGIVKMNQIVAYASGIDYGLGLMALPKAFKDFNAWVIERMRNPASIYNCYADLFL